MGSSKDTGNGKDNAIAPTQTQSSSSDSKPKENNSSPPELPKTEYPPMPKLKSLIQEESNSYNYSKNNDLSYLPPVMPPNFYQQEGVKEKLIRKTKDNPFVPIGCIATGIVLGKGLTTLAKGESAQVQNFWMRMRVGCQFFAVACFGLGVWYETIKSRAPEDAADPVKT